MSRTVVASQPFYFPWLGFLEQIRHAQVFVSVGDFQYVRNGFINRVQIKRPHGTHLLTIPVYGARERKRIDEMRIDDSTPWRRLQLESLEHFYKKAPYRDEMLGMASAVINRKTDSLLELVEESMRVLFEYFELIPSREFRTNKELGTTGTKTDRVLALVKAVNGTRYVTGHGAARYLDHERLEREGVSTEYITYLKEPYNQLYPPFTPYVSALDAVANLGKRCVDQLKSPVVPWREFTRSVRMEDLDSQFDVSESGS